MTDKPVLPGDAGADQTLQPGAKTLLRVVYIMGVILVLLLIALVVGIIWKATSRSGAKVPGATTQLNLGLAPDASVSAITIDGDRMVVTTATEIVVVDLRKNAIVSRIVLKAQ